MSEQNPPQDNNDRLKDKTAASLKWNLIDKILTQALYAVTGIVLARELSQEDFGLAGAVLVFQAFAGLLVDSGFSYALLQRKNPTRLDYSTVLWFNTASAAALYCVLFLCAPLIAGLFGGNALLVPVMRVMCLSLIINSCAIVQHNILTKRMDVRPITTANAIATLIAGVMAIAMALSGWGVWALVAQALCLGIVKNIILWISTRWLPLPAFSWKALKSFMPLGASMAASSFLNTLFQNIYAFFIGNRVSLTALGYYTQADKWSKIPSSSLSQTLTGALIPALSTVQDDAARFRRVAAKSSRFTAYLLFPLMLWLTATATPIFHALFGQKWDASVILFQLLLIRGIFTVLTSLYGNYLIALGHGRDMLRQETVRDLAALAALAATLPFIADTRPGNPVWGIAMMLAGQLLASAATWIYTLAVCCRRTGATVGSYLKDLLPYLLISILILPIIYAISLIPLPPIATAALQLSLAAAAYIAICRMMHSVIQQEVFSHIAKIFARKKT